MNPRSRKGYRKLPEVNRELDTHDNNGGYLLDLDNNRFKFCNFYSFYC